MRCARSSPRTDGTTKRQCEHSAWIVRSSSTGAPSDGSAVTSDGRTGARSASRRDVTGAVGAVTPPCPPSHVVHRRAPDMLVLAAGRPSPRQRPARAPGVRTRWGQYGRGHRATARGLGGAGELKGVRHRVDHRPWVRVLRRLHLCERAIAQGACTARGQPARRRHHPQAYGRRRRTGCQQEAFHHLDHCEGLRERLAVGAQAQARHARGRCRRRGCQPGRWCGRHRRRRRSPGRRRGRRRIGGRVAGAARGRASVRPATTAARARRVAGAEALLTRCRGPVRHIALPACLVGDAAKSLRQQSRLDSAQSKRPVPRPTRWRSRSRPRPTARAPSRRPPQRMRRTARPATVRACFPNATTRGHRPRAYVADSRSNRVRAVRWCHARRRGVALASRGKTALTEEEVLRRTENARRAAHLRRQKQEEAKRATVHRLLNKQESKKAKRDDGAKVSATGGRNTAGPRADQGRGACGACARHRNGTKRAYVRMARHCCTFRPHAPARRFRCPRALRGRRFLRSSHRQQGAERARATPGSAARGRGLTRRLRRGDAVVHTGPAHTSPPKVCARPGCGQPRRYTHKAAGVPICSLACYQHLSCSTPAGP